MSQCDDALAEVYGYLDREIGWYQNWRIKRHLAGCHGCVDAYGFEERLRVVIRTRLAEEVPPEFLERLRQALASEHPG
ncbi:MAG: zf-HC2 domain-containing protein [Actinomycetota bacterium]